MARARIRDAHEEDDDLVGGVGHNSRGTDGAQISRGRNETVAGERLKSFIERIEKLEEERASLGADIREVYSEAKGSGFDIKIMRKVVALRKMEPAERAEIDELLDIYKQAIGMI